eukprot:CAMPEP_0172509844 /NCGR_PEP_ID=MMETSP1066-20121228/223762_1 /TAXON_ID=671091 /ORGANISM="Coscinodiscus wailesii, Strain CCMP2513" /LENGTH=187 /DNA_ID=CAMNT_0013288539 /DNA_START=149 /DNA_END=712 /DNA_ORIENTATION=-
MTVLDKIIYTIRTLQSGSSPNGSSRIAIVKYLKSEFDYDKAPAIKLALKKGVDSGALTQKGQSFRVTADPQIEAVITEEETLRSEDVKLGKEGTEAVSRGDNVTVKYVGTLDDGSQFDSANSFTFMLGGGEVIKGWDEGILGMREGGKRKLTVPSRLGYGKRGCAPDIPPNATLHFVVTLKKIARGS